MPEGTLASAVRPDSEAAFRRDVGRRLFIRRSWLRLSQDEVAQRAQVTRNFVSAIERGAQGLDAWRLWAVADALGASLDWLLAGPDNAATTRAPGRSGGSGG
jgi:transcriptional regulator with XRE-family HTH domain